MIQESKFRSNTPRLIFHCSQSFRRILLFESDGKEEEEQNDSNLNNISHAGDILFS